MPRKATKKGTTKAAPKEEAPAPVEKTSNKRKADGAEEPAVKKAKVETPKFTINVPLAPVVDVMVLGSGEVGQLGLGRKFLGRKRPTVVPEVQNKRVLKLEVGGLHNAVLVQNDEGDHTNTTLWTWGCNDNKILGRETPVQEDEEIDLSMKPDVVPALEGKRIVNVTSGEYHMTALSNTGQVYLWGTYKDDEGFLGYAEDQRIEQDEPLLFPGMKDRTVKQIVSGHNHTLAMTSNGDVFIWGFDWLGKKVSDRLKRGHLQPKRVIFHKKKRGGEPKIAYIAAGGYHNFAVAKNGTVWAWGLNNLGQLGVGNDNKTGKPVNMGAPTEVEGLSHKNIKQISAGMHHTIVLTEEGKVYSFGKNDYGQLGIDSREASSVPVEIPFFNNLPNGDKVIQVSTIDNHCTAVTEQGNAYSWGFGDRGQLGNATADDEGQDALTPFLIQGPQLKGRKVTYAGAGGQHTALLALPLPPSAEGEAQSK